MYKVKLEKYRFIYLQNSGLSEQKLPFLLQMTLIYQSFSLETETDQKQI